MTTDCSHFVVTLVVRFRTVKFRVLRHLTTRLQHMVLTLRAHEDYQKICSHVVTYVKTSYRTIKTLTTRVTTLRLHDYNERGVCHE
jgi:hypothetical protein